jgi:hypothetical protein
MARSERVKPMRLSPLRRSRSSARQSRSPLFERGICKFLGRSRARSNIQLPRCRAASRASWRSAFVLIARDSSSAAEFYERLAAPLSTTPDLPWFAKRNRSPRLLLSQCYSLMCRSAIGLIGRCFRAAHWRTGSWGRVHRRKRFTASGTARAAVVRFVPGSAASAARPEIRSRSCIRPTA